MVKESKEVPRSRVGGWFSVRRWANLLQALLLASHPLELLAHALACHLLLALDHLVGVRPRTHRLLPPKIQPVSIYHHQPATHRSHGPLATLDAFSWPARIIGARISYIAKNTSC